LRDYNVKEIGRDASGNLKYVDIGEVLRDEIKKYAMEKGLASDVKYINPHYMVRAGKSNAYDTKMCT
jgi:6-phosphofructokinase 1